MTDQIIARIFLVLAIFGLAANGIGFVYLVVNTVKSLAGN